MLKKKFLTVFLAGFMLSGFQGAVFARLTNQALETNPDQWACCKSGSEAIVDSSGNFIPGTASNQNIGSATLPWLSIYTGALTTSGARVASPGAVQTVNNAGSSTISPSSEFVLISSTGPILLVASAIMSTTTATNGQLVTILSTSSVIGLSSDLNASTSFNIVSATGGVYVQVSTFAPVSFVYSSIFGKWIQKK